MQKLILLNLVFILFQSCIGNKKLSQLPPYVSLDVPYMAVSKNGLDTTFDYKVLESDIKTTLPKNIIGKKVIGSVEFYSIINANKQVTDIKIISCKFYRKKRLVHDCPENKNNEANTMLKNHLLKFMQNIPFNQNKAVSKELHPTYCFVRVY